MVNFKHLINQNLITFDIIKDKLFKDINKRFYYCQ